MGLTNKQKNWITKNRNKSSIQKMSKALGINQGEIENFLNEASDKTIPNKKPPLIFNLILVLIPLLFFIILEMSLKVFDYGINTEQWITVHNDKYVTNPNIAHRYFFNTENLPGTIGDAFDKTKKPNSFRVFVLGGSSAAGYPFMPIGSFSRYIKKRLELVYPETKIEVVNTAISATNSYTIRDLMPGVLDQEPDLILIYAGHNEYYGTLGVGSNEYLGSSRFVVNTALYLNHFKTYELLRNIIKETTKLFSSERKNTSAGTLMSQIVKDQYIPYKSEKFEDGIEQFEGNLKDILDMATKKKVPVILGTVACNLKDQYPLENTYKNAGGIFEKAKELLDEGKQKEALAKFRTAKQLDAVRFRAPDEINETIKKLGKDYRCSVIDIDSVFNAISPEGITGNNLMMDHLHPNLEGYQIIGKLFYEEMEKLDLLPKSQVMINDNNAQDSITKANFDFSKLDSTIAAYEIKSLKNNWPFVEAGKSKLFYQLVVDKNFTDSIASKVVTGKLSWETAQGLTIQKYLRDGDYEKFEQQVKVLISQFPYSIEIYDLAIKNLIRAKGSESAYNLLLKRHKLQPDDFTTMWLGIIELTRSNEDEAINYFNESLRYNGSNIQVLYNLAVAYFYKEEYEKAASTINICLSKSPNLPEAKALQQQLYGLIKKQ